MKIGGSPARPRKDGRTELGEYIVADGSICGGRPTFKGTRIMVWQVLADVAEGRSWEFISNTRWGGRLPMPAIAEAVTLAAKALLDKDGHLADEAATRPRLAKAA